MAKRMFQEAIDLKTRHARAAAWLLAALLAGAGADVPGLASVIVGSWWGSQPAHAGNQRIR